VPEEIQENRQNIHRINQLGRNKPFQQASLLIPPGVLDRIRKSGIDFNAKKAANTITIPGRIIQGYKQQLN